MPEARLARPDDLDGVIALFQASEVSAVVGPRERAAHVWERILSREGVAVFVSEIDGAVVATCMLITVPNLLRSGRQHGFLEDVVTHPEHRGRGHGHAVVAAALDEAWRQDCHHVLLQSGRTDPRVRRFYESCGFRSDVRTAYVAQRSQDLCHP
ncbi:MULTISPECIES: GNAT family N-acetyltransferase [unclassified Bradyrhizobium]|uniref:GNAT family N-acetyltransferase n=1 Tax=unclassified Bradyrhizobium TaxID=2631580 RepID=UPI002916DF07|nr:MULTISPECIES: GNAT family N-acetyltransferase [unclassified Bradyrhizobium]